MDTVSPQLEVVASAIAELRAAGGAAQRIDAVRRASDALLRLTHADRRVLAEGLLANGAPAAGRLLVQRADGRFPAEAVTAVAQDLLALAPVQAAQLADQLQEEVAAGRAAAGTATPRPAGDPTPSGEVAASASTGDPTTTGPPPVPATAQHRAGGGTTSRRSGPTSASTSASPSARATSPATSPRPALGSPDGRGSSSRSAPDLDGRVLVEQLAREPSLRARRQVVAAGDARRPLAVDTLLEVLAGIPDGWQRRVALRRVLTVLPVAVGGRGDELLQLFAAPGDRFAAAALLVRRGLASVDTLTASLEPRAARRLEARAARTTR